MTEQHRERLPPAGATATPLATVCWLDSRGARVDSYPLSRRQAEAVALAYTAAYPRLSFWVEDIPWLVHGRRQDRPAV